MTDAEVEDYRTEMEGIKVSALQANLLLKFDSFSAKANMSQNQSRTGLSAA